MVSNQPAYYWLHSKADARVAQNSGLGRDHHDAAQEGFIAQPGVPTKGVTFWGDAPKLAAQYPFSSQNEPLQRLAQASPPL